MSTTCELQGHNLKVSKRDGWGNPTEFTCIWCQKVLPYTPGLIPEQRAPKL